MARYHALATGNFTTLATWGLVDPTVILDTEASSHTVTTLYTGTRTTAQTPGVITVAGICLRLRTQSGGTGTMSVELYNSTLAAPVAATEVTINVSDLPTASVSNEGGWIYFEFASPVTLSAVTAYSVEVKTSVGSQITLYRDATAGNVSHLLVTTANPGSLAAGDTFGISSRKTGAGAQTNVTITMDNTVTTDFGAGTDAVQAITISHGATLDFGTTASTNYYLKLSGDLILYTGGTLNVGTTGTPMPASATAVIEFDPVADAGMGIIARQGSTVTMQGASKTVAAYLAADAASSATSLTTDVSTSWKNGDLIGIASTTRTASECETKSLGADASGTSLPTIGALTNAHSGTNPTRAELINLTRNIMVRSASSTIMSYIDFKSTVTVDIDFVDFRYLGDNTTAKRGVDIETTSGGSCSINGCSFRDFEDQGAYIEGATGSVTFTNNVMYNTGSSGSTSNPALTVFATSGAHTITGNIFMAHVGAASNGVVDLQDVGGIFSNNTVVGSTGSTVEGIQLNETALIGTFSGNVVHSCSNASTSALEISGCYGIISSCSVWRNNNIGITNSVFSTSGRLTFSNCSFFGQASSSGNINFSDSGNANVLFTGCTFDGDPTFATTCGIRIAVTTGNVDLTLINCDFGVTTAHTTADINVAAESVFKITAINCRFASGTEWAHGSGANLTYSSFIRSHRHDQSATTFKSQYRYGTINQDTTTRHTASGYSWQLTPNSATQKLRFPGPTEFDTFKVACPANVARTVSMYVQKDGSYNGNAPRLVVVGGLVQGISTDQISSLTVGSSTWEQLTVTVTPTEDSAIEFYVDCDGTAGSVYCDDAGIV